MQPSTVLSRPAAAGPPPERAGDRAVDDLGAAVVGLLRGWRGLTRRAGESTRTGLTALEMAILIGEGEHRLSELAELRTVDQSVISRQIGDLEADGLICRRPDPADRRASLVRLTPEGLLMLDRARTLRRAWLRDALARTSTVDVRAAVELITALTAELVAHAADIGPAAALRPGSAPPEAAPTFVTKGTATP
jgi:DNA-binding MarR family transcriptional regulator